MQGPSTVVHVATVSEPARALLRNKRHFRIMCVPPLIPQNPYQRLLYRALAERGFELLPESTLHIHRLLRLRARAGIVHIHWPQSCYRHDGPSVLSWLKLLIFVLRLAAARVLGYRIVWTVHQVLPHEVRSQRLDHAASVALADLSNVLVVHDRKTADDVAKLLPRNTSKLRVVPHGSYVGVYPPGRARADVRAELGVTADACVFLSFGHLRAYKDVDVLLDAFGLVQSRSTALVIAGLPLDHSLTTRLETAAILDERIRILPRFIPEDGVSELFGAADVAVLPRGDGGTSGALILALSLGLPVIAARTQTAVDLTEADGAAWWFQPGDSRDLAAVIENVSRDPENRIAKQHGARAAAERLSWSQAAELLDPVLLREDAR